MSELKDTKGAHQEIPSSLTSKNKKKAKKLSNRVIDMKEEFLKDPKYKTQLCKAYKENGSCIYLERCRFAHGEEQLFQKTNSHPKFKIKKCKSFYDNGFCTFGENCHFIHHENKAKVFKLYYSFMINTELIDSCDQSDIKSSDTCSSSGGSLNSHKDCNYEEENLYTTLVKKTQRRLRVFQSISPSEIINESDEEMCVESSKIN